MPSSTSETAREVIRAEALATGFDVVRFSHAREPRNAGGRLRDFLAEGRHGDMEWMANNESRRADPVALWPDAKSIVVVGLNYGPTGDPLATLSERDRGTISVYARGDDYHDVVKKKLRHLAQFVARRFSTDVKLFVDTAPVMEKPIAEAAGVGWLGKHTNLVSRDFGSWLFLGSIFTTLELAPDVVETDHCGQCRRCIDVCPTNAFPAPYQLDARRCISYLTIEHRGHIACEFREPIGNRIYGCDDCLAVCPWNKFATASREMQLNARAELRRPRLADLVGLTNETFRTVFRGSPIKRIGRNRFVRNVLIAIGNSHDANLAPRARALLDDASPLVRAMAVWALSRLLTPEEFNSVGAQHASAEADAEVKAEWLACAQASHH
jgi:epoxyqueuosine reductase